MQRDPALERAIEAIGGYTATAEAIGVSVPTVWRWEKCPLHRVREISRLSGVPAHELAPDHWDAPVETDRHG